MSSNGFHRTSAPVMTGGFTGLLLHDPTSATVACFQGNWIARYSQGRRHRSAREGVTRKAVQRLVAATSAAS